MLLTKCCCCCDLRYGYFAYGILSMAARLIACVSLYHVSTMLVGLSPGLSSQRHVFQVILAQVISVYGGWVLTSAICLFFTLKGILQERSILIYPYVVVLVVELIGLLISGILSAVYVTAYYLIALPFAVGLLLYELWSLISLYKQMKYNERMKYIEDVRYVKTV